VAARTTVKKDGSGPTLDTVARAGWLGGGSGLLSGRLDMIRYSVKSPLPIDELVVELVKLLLPRAGGGGTS
jgi:hypothetical protein